MDESRLTRFRRVPKRNSFFDDSVRREAPVSSIALFFGNHNSLDAGLIGGFYKFRNHSRFFANVAFLECFLLIQAKKKGGIMPDQPIFLAGCRVTADPGDKEHPVQLECAYDRERLPNPELRKGLFCRPETEFHKEGDKRIFIYKVMCYPGEPMKLVHARTHAPEQLKRLLEAEKARRESERP